MGFRPKGRGFVFRNPGRLEDGELSLALVERHPAIPHKGYVPAYEFEMRVDAARVGAIILRAGTTPEVEQYAGHVGYGVAPAHRGHRFAARSVALLVPLAIAHRLHPLWITCDPDNAASRRTCELAGARYVETVAIPESIEMYAEGARFRCRYALSTRDAMTAAASTDRSRAATGARAGR